jgi:hypothetical protein
MANASHELRTPLAVMPATVDVVLDNPDSTPSDLRGMGANIRTAVDHAAQLISTLLILARNERGLTVYEDVDLATVAEDVHDTAGVRDRQVHATLGPAVISGDPVLVERLIANLLDNAERYNATGGEIWISTRTAAGSGQLTVANTGPSSARGMPTASSSPSSGSATAHPRTASDSAWPSSRRSLRSTAAPSPPAPATAAACPSRSQSPRPAPWPRVSVIRLLLILLTPDHEHFPRRRALKADG